MQSLKPQLGSLEREVSDQELGMRGRVDGWGSLAAHVYEAEVVTQWVIYEPDDRVLYTNTRLQDPCHREKLRTGNLYCGDLPFVRPLATLPDGLRLPVHATTRAVVFESPNQDRDYRGALIRRYSDDVLYVWSVILDASRWAAIAGRCQDINEAFERHEAKTESAITAGVAKELRVESFEILEMLATRMHEHGMLDSQEVEDVRDVIDAIIQEVRSV